MPLAQMPLFPAPDQPDLAEWEHSLCFTGHRPEKLPEGEALEALLGALEHAIESAVDLGFDRFYTGLADGIDYYAARYLFGLRSTRPLRVIGVQPCADFHEVYRYFGHDTNRLEEMLGQADEVIVLPGNRFDKDVYRARNYYMVEHSSALIAVCDNSRSGSMQTLRYAKQLGLAYCRLFPSSEAPFPAPQDWPAEHYGI
jgi:uncharacterized phage-like protein YoqJ